MRKWIPSQKESKVIQCPNCNHHISGGTGLKSPKDLSPQMSGAVPEPETEPETATIV
jgi:hypothetical protein